jgi:predicted helicase
MVRVTSPFLKEMLETFLKVGGRKGEIDFDELGIQDVVELLRGDETDLPAILRDFGNRTRGEDPVIHFYEHFLSAYNKKLKIQRGVFYTPQPVVSYIVRSVHELLQTEFGLEDGLAATVTWGEMIQRRKGLELPTTNDPNTAKKTISPDEPFVQILDPATGTATFLVEAVDVIFKHLEAKWKKGGLAALPAIKNSKLKFQNFPDYWNQYVPEHLLPRLHGYELLAAPYAIAHLKLGLKLTETGYRFGSAERARIYLTNALEPKVNQLPQIGFEPLAHEAHAVNEIKWYKRFTVVIGNPPYSVSSQNDGNWIVSLCEDFKKGLENERNIQPLSDDYIKFMRLALFLIESTKIGIIAMITNREYIQGVIHRTIRSRLIDASNRVSITDLHGQRGELIRDGILDENVFQIEKGVAIGIYSFGVSNAKKIEYGEILGIEAEKTKTLAHALSSTLAKLPLTPSSPQFFLKPWKTDFTVDYHAMPSLLEFFTRRPVTGFATHRDHFAVDFTKEALVMRLRKFLDSNISDDDIRIEFELGDTRDWQLHQARIRARRDKNIFDRIILCDYRPFDCRWVVYSDDILEYSRRDAMQHVSEKNLALICSRIVKDELFAHAFVSQHPIEKIFLSPKSSNNAQVCLTGEINQAGETFLSVGPVIILPRSKDSAVSADQHDLLSYIYALLHSPGYRSRYAEFLKIDFPRLPLTGKLELFRALARLGGELTALHLLESPKLDKPITEYLGGRSPEVEKPTWSNNTVWLDKAQTIGFQGVREDVWNFHIGGYQVCEKWLKDRKGRELSAADRTHYQKIVVALSETIRLMGEIDAVIEKNGGWPLK